MQNPDVIIKLQEQLQNAGSLWDGVLNPVTAMDNALNGTSTMSFSEILLSVLAELFKQLTGNVGTVIYIIGISYLSAFVFALSAPEKAAWSEAVLIVVAAILAVPIVNDFMRTISLAGGTMDSMSALTLASLPTLGTVSLNGGTGVFMVIAQLTALLIKNILLPLAVICGALSFCEVITDRFNIGGIRTMFRSLFSWILGISMAVFAFSTSISGIVTRSFSSIGNRTIKYAGSMVPVVGRYLSESADLVFSGASIVKDAAGIGVMVGVIVICLLPFIKMLAIVILYRLAVVFISPVVNEKIKRLVTALADALSMIMSVTALLGIMYIVNIAVLVSIGRSL